jgi:hypothetical protein
VVPPPLGASIQAIVSPPKYEGIPEALYVFFPFFSAIFILAMWSKVTINFPRTEK